MQTMEKEKQNSYNPESLRISSPPSDVDVRGWLILDNYNFHFTFESNRSFFKKQINKK